MEIDWTLHKGDVWCTLEKGSALTNLTAPMAISYTQISNSTTAHK